MRPLRHIVSWLIALALVAFFVHFTLHPLPNPPPGEVKFFDPPGQHAVFASLAERSGVTLFEPAGRFVSGILEVLAALLLLLPPVRRLGAALAVLILGTGVGLHLSPWLGREIPLAAGAAGTDGGAHFLLVVVFLAASLLLLVAHPAPERDGR